jgi:hypothetical protein
MMTVVVEATEELQAVGVEISVAIAPGPEHKSLEMPHRHSLSESLEVLHELTGSAF